MFRKEDIPESFVQQIIDCGEFFKAHQCEAILSNLRTFERSGNVNVDPDIQRIKHLVSERFIKTYELKKLASEDMKILGKQSINDKSSEIFDFSTPPSSYNSRQKQRERDPKERLTDYALIFESPNLPSNENKFKLDGTSDELLISTGKPYEKIESSKFSAVRILQIYNEVLRLGNELGFSGTIPSPEVIKEFEEENKSIKKVLNFEYTSQPNNHKLINQIYNALSNVEKNQSLVLLGYSMLSRLNVGLLYFLARTFDSVEIEPSDKCGCIITLKDFKEVEAVKKIFEQIIVASRAAEQIGHAVLSVLPITKLCDSLQYEDIAKMNHRIMRHCVRQIVASCLKNYGKYANATKTRI
ncbi:uncharacterized protein [Venturia canescens]|uniref:uncharacterized protein n=1 Tax=Venturia canescens TaxID=32260 RepID=UPI001C9C3E9B|nr:uncharacterized protein LOC122410481 [Venturia canescens]